MSDNQKTTISINSDPSVTMTPEMIDWVQEIRRHANLIAGYKKETEHWQKRELESVIVCGENLVKIRKSYGDLGTGFKQFVMNEFKTEFSYSTALRYMKLYHGRQDITSDITNIRQSYIKLGIMKESYSYPEEETNANSSSGTNTNATPSSKQPKQRKNTPKRSLNDLLPHSNSIYLTWKDEKTPNTTHHIYEFTLNADKVLMARSVVNQTQLSIVKPAGIEWFVNRLAPLVGWYNQQVGGATKVTPLPIQQPDQFKMAA